MQYRNSGKKNNQVDNTENSSPVNKYDVPKTSLNTAIIKADIEASKRLIYGEDYPQEEVQSYLLNLAGYHSAQAIEKSLKLMIYNINPVECQNVGKTHSIVTLVEKISELREGFAYAHQELRMNKHQLSWLNNLRYGEGANLSKSDVNIALGLAQQLHRELEADRGLTRKINDGQNHYADFDLRKNNGRKERMNWRGKFYDHTKTEK